MNFSVFQYEVWGNPDETCKMALTAFEDASAELNNVAEDYYKDSTLIMQCSVTTCLSGPPTRRVAPSLESA